MQHKIKLIRQLGTTDCGAVCLYMIFNYYSAKVKLFDIRSCFPIGRDGMTLLQMKTIAQRFGFELHAYNYEYNEVLLDENLPVILCSKYNHYIVVAEKTDNGFVILDPAEGKKEVRFNYISENYLDILVCIRPSEQYKIVKRQVENDRKSFRLVPNKVKVFFSVIATVISQLLILCVPQLIQIVVDSADNNDTYNVLGWILITVCIWGGLYLISYFKENITLSLEMDLYKDTMNGLISKIFKIDVNYFSSHSSGDIISRFSNASTIFQFISNNIVATVIDLITAIVCAISMCQISLLLFCVVLFFTVVQIIVLIIVYNKQREETQNYYCTQAELENRLVDILTNMVSVREMGYDERLEKRLKGEYGKLILSTQKRGKYNNIINNTVKSLGTITSLFLYVVGVKMILDGLLSMGNLVAFITLSTYFSGPFQTMVLIFPQLASIKETWDRLEEIAEYPDKKKKSGSKEIEKILDISLKNVSYQYVSAKEKCLVDINLNIKKGDKIAILGESGSGKTTLIKILMDVIQPTQGRIEINSMSLDEITAESLHKRISVVTQNTFLIGTTIRDNVDFYHLLTDEDIYNALDFAEIGTEIRQFPLGLYTQIGEDGQNISGGQKQRLAIARAIATKPEIIIFDEATSNLDPQTEVKVYDNLKRSGMTQIIVTHRLQAIQDSDLIIMINKGKIVEQGKHERLIRNKSFYYRQFGVYSKENA